MNLSKQFGTLILLLCCFLTIGCSIRRMAMGQLTDALSSSNSTIFTGEEDPQLAADALPFTMKLYETLLERNRHSPDLNLATGRLFSLYAYAFVAFPADTFADQRSPECKALRTRAKRLFLRGRDYCLAGLECTHPGITSQLKNGSLDSALARTRLADTSLLYWTAMSWGSAIGVDRTDLALALTAKRVLSIMERVIALKDSYGNGAAHQFLIPYCAAIPASLGGGERIARDHFEKAVHFGGDVQTGPYLLLATSVSLKGDREEFTRLLQTALAITNDPPQLRLVNTLYRRRARWLLDNEDRFFKSAP